MNGLPAPDRRRLFSGLALLGALAAFALAGPLLVSADPAIQDLRRTLEAPGVEHLLGTDHLGRDLLARLAHAARLSLGLAAFSVAVAATIGSASGIAAAWLGGWTERIAVSLADAVLALPGLLLVLIVTAFAPGEGWPIYLGIALATWVEYFRVVRASARAVLAGPAVESSRLLGFGPAYIVRRHVLPEIAPVATTMMAFGAGGAVLAMAALGFVGVGLKPPTPELGLMMTELLPHYHEAPWLIAAPVALLALFILSLVLIAGERDPR
jgi:peptide/nickel transport system permease protein